MTYFIRRGTAGAQPFPAGRQGPAGARAPAGPCLAPPLKSSDNDLTLL